MGRGECLAPDTDRRFKHGHARLNAATPEYRAWRSMYERCYNKASNSYTNYGGRGIKVCARWLASFENFLADIGPRPSPAHSIDRIDTNGNYEPGNVRWATPYVQGRNRRNNCKISIAGTTKCLTDWLAIYGVSASTYKARRRMGWDVIRAITQPLHADRAGAARLSWKTRNRKKEVTNEPE